MGLLDEPLKVTCGECGTVMVVDRRTGNVLETRKPLLEKGEQTGDRWEDARKKVESASDRIAAKAEAARQAQKEKLAKLDALFSERKKEIEESGEPIEKPDDPFRD